MVVPSLHARAAVEQQRKMFTDSWDPLFIGYSAVVYFHTCETKINSWTTQAKKMRGSIPPKFEVREVLKTLEKAGLESKLPVYGDGRMIMKEGHLALKDEMKFSTIKYLAPYGLQEVELQQEGVFYMPLTEYKVVDLSGDDWANRKNLELPLASEPSNMGMVLLTDEVREKNTFEDNKGMFLSTLVKDVAEFLERIQPEGGKQS